MSQRAFYLGIASRVPVIRQETERRMSSGLEGGGHFKVVLNLRNPPLRLRILDSVGRSQGSRALLR
jgi:hypothetical protein